MDRIKAILAKLLEKRGAVRESKERKGGKHAAIASMDPYAFQAAHRRLAWYARMVTALLIVSGVGNVISIQTISELVPLKETEFVMIRTYCEDGRTYSAEPVSRDLDGFTTFMEGRARHFVKTLLEIDSVTQEERQREASQMSDENYWKKFRRERIVSGEISTALKKGIDREIIVETVTEIPTLTDNNDFKFAVDFTQIDRRNGEVIDGGTKTLRAFVSMVTRPQQNIPEKEKYTNPFGAYVTDLVLRSRGA